MTSILHYPVVRWGCVICALVGLAACNEAPSQTVERPRPIKIFVVGEATGGMVRKFNGEIEAATTTTLSFPIAGTVQDVLVKVGDAVARGDVLARLEPEPFDLDVQAAEAELQSALSVLSSKEADLKRQKSLLDRDWVAPAAVEKFQSAYESALSQVDYARSRLALANRNLANAALSAPFDGVIAERFVEPFQDVGIGQRLFSLNATDAFEVAFSVPETNISMIAVGQPVTATAATVAGDVSARITEIATMASAGNAYAIKASLLDPPPEYRSGMTATVTLAGSAPSNEVGYFIPLSAIAPAEGPYRGTVFKYDADAGVVRRTPIVATGVRDNLVIVREGIAPGDIIASAGVAFLVDGQAVGLLGE